MVVKYELTLADYLSAQKLHAKWSDRAILIRNTIWTLLLTIGLAALFFEEYAAVGGLTGAVVGSFFIPFFWNNVVAQIVSRLKYKKLTQLHKSQSISIVEKGLAYGVSQTVIEWDKFEKWRENPSYILAYLKKSTFLVIPKRIADQGINVNEIKSHLLAKAGDPT